MSRAGLVLLVASLLPIQVHAAVAPPSRQWIVVTAPAFRAAVEPLCQARRSQGLRVVVVTTTDVLTRAELRAGQAGQLRDHVRALCRAHHGNSSVLLVGAVESVFDDRVVPPLRGTIGRMKDQPTDAPYGCPDGGRLPSVAVGRFPARTALEARSMVARTLAFERAGAIPGAWKRRLTVLAGIPAYNPLVDRLVENMAMARFARIHPAWTGRALYTNPLSRFCVPDRLLRTQALELLRQGQAFTFYLGHSNAAGLYGGPAAFLDRDDWGKAILPHGGGVFVTFGCNGCQLEGIDGEGYGLVAIRNPHGPAAVVGSHGICFAAMAQLGGDGLFKEAFQGRLPCRLAAAWLALLEGVARGKIDFLSYRLLDAVDGDPRIPQATQRQEHLEMFVLLGDPALRLPLVRDDVILNTPNTVRPGTSLVVAGHLPAGLEAARVEVSLERSAASVPADLAPLPGNPGPARDRVLLANHERANRFVVTRASTTARDGQFRLVLEVPPSLPMTRATLRVYAVTRSDEALTVRRLKVRKGP
jgi:hypothetical protein